MKGLRLMKSLTELKINECAIIKQINELMLEGSCYLKGDVEIKLLEMGFIEGAKIKVLYFGAIRSDPIAVRINNSNNIVSLRKKEASIVLVETLKDAN